MAPADISSTGILSRSPGEIGRVLTMLMGRGQEMKADLQEGTLVFVSRLRIVDPGHAFIVLDADANEAANAALLARPRASFHAEPDGWHIEFAAAGPQRVQVSGKPAIRLQFPDILVTQQRRREERHAVPEQPLHFVADAGGIISFDGDLVDLSAAGIGFLQYPPGITLEPGTVLRGCRIEAPGKSPVTVDLEVRYSQAVTLPSGERAVRSGCRFMSPSPEVKALLEAFFKR